MAIYCLCSHERVRKLGDVLFNKGTNPTHEGSPPLRNHFSKNTITLRTRISTYDFGGHTFSLQYCRLNVCMSPERVSLTSTHQAYQVA